MAEARLKEVETYVIFRHNSIVQYIVNCPMLELCLEADQRLGVQVVW